MVTDEEISVACAADMALVITRQFNVPPEVVFRAWTEPGQAKRWWGPRGFTCPVFESDLRVEGVSFTCMRSPDGRNYWSRGVYREIEPPRRIVVTDSFADEHGNVVSPRDYGMSADWPEEALVSVTFEERDGRTLLSLEHVPIKPGTERDMCRQGWNEMLDKLEEYLAKSGAE